MGKEGIVLTTNCANQMHVYILSYCALHFTFPFETHYIQLFASCFVLLKIFRVSMKRKREYQRANNSAEK